MTVADLPAIPRNISTALRYAGFESAAGHGLGYRCSPRRFFDSRPPETMIEFGVIGADAIREWSALTLQHQNTVRNHVFEQWMAVLGPGGRGWDVVRGGECVIVRGRSKR